MKIYQDKLILRTFLICLLIGIITFIPFIIVDGGYLTLCDDYNTQMIPFASALNNSFRNHEGSWQWNIGLGAQRLGGNSYYYLGSPLFYLSMLLPGQYFPYLVGPLYILKYALAGMFSYMYLRKYVNNKSYAIAGSMLYAFSGFQSINLEFYMFHDVVAFFPLLMIGIDDLYEKERKNFFIFAVALNCALNYFFFFGEVVFLLIYVLFRYIKELGKDLFIRRSLICIYSGIIGMGVVSSIFIPSAIYTFGNPRVLPDIVRMFHKKVDILAILKGFLIPAEAMNNYSIVSPTNWNSISCYIPLLGLSLAIAYIIKNRSWLTNIIIFCFIISFFSVAVSTFYIYTNPYYRWWYMYILLIIVASIQVLDNPDNYQIRKSTYIFSLISFIFVSLFWIGNSLNVERFKIYRPKIYLLLSAIVILSIFASIILTYQKKNISTKYLLTIAFLCILTTATAIVLYRKTTHEENYKAYYEAGLSLEACDEQYRYASGDNLLMYPGNANGTGTFNSTISNSVRDFEDLFGYFSISTNMDTHDYDGLTELLAGKYEIIREEHCYETYSIEEREACPIGYYYDSYITDDELLNVDIDKRGYVLLRDLVISKEDSELFTDVLTHDEDYASADTLSSINDYVTINTTNKVEDFHRIHSGFECTTNAESGHVYFFSVPYDAGWHLTIDGNKSDIIYSSGFIAVYVPSGSHHLVFKYRSPGLILGTVLCIISIIAWGVLYKKDKKNAMLI